MRIVLQRCSRAEVRIDGNIVGQIGKGFVLLVGITDGDSSAEADYLAKKVAQMRVFEDAEGMPTMRALARNMTFLMRSIELGKEKYGLPKQESPRYWTNFIR